MSIETDWQTTSPTIRERATFMLNNDRLSDVKFVVRKSDGESESKKVIPAHKFVLSISSPVFETMFYGELAETRDAIELPDCEYESLLELFRYMYSDEVKLSGSNVMGVLYLSKKYMVPSLAVKCTEFLQKNLDPSNVFNILPTAQRYEEKSLVDRCWKVIEAQTKAAVRSDAFETIERSLLEAVVSKDTLTKIKEVALFKAVDLWAAKQCQKQGLTEDGQLKRRILGEQIIKAIRFTLMKQKEFSAVVLDTNILTPDEVIVFFKFFSLTSHSPVGFSETRRRSGVIHRCGRFDSTLSGGWDYGGMKDLLGFAVDKDITLHGLCFFGRANSNYTVTLEVKDTSNNSTLVSKAGTYSSKLLQFKRKSYHGFEVLFDSTAVLEKNTVYQIEASISGPTSWRGCKGSSTVKVSGVTFTFSTVDRSDSNGTTNTLERRLPPIDGSDVNFRRMHERRILNKSYKRQRKRKQKLEKLE